MNECELTIMIPAYLEEENLRILLPRLNYEIRKLTSEFEIIVVDTMQPLDHTRQVCDEHGVVYVNREGGNEFGCALRTGIKYTNGRSLITMDADGSHSPEFIKDLFAYREDYDVVIASRYVKGGYTENSKVLVYLSSILNVTYRVILGLKCKDVSNNFKLYRTAQIKSLQLFCLNFDIVEEILFKLTRQFDIRIHEVPFTFRKRMFGDTKRNLVSFIFTYLITLVRLRSVIP